jgi:hypothetical protein
LKPRGRSSEGRLRAPFVFLAWGESGKDVVDPTRLNDGQIGLCLVTERDEHGAHGAAGSRRERGDAGCDARQLVEPVADAIVTVYWRCGFHVLTIG